MSFIDQLLAAGGGPAATMPVASSGDPFAAIRTLDFTMTPGADPRQVGRAAMWDPRLTQDTWSTDWDVLRAGGFQSKYNQVERMPDGTLRVRMQQPGRHKYDTMDVFYREDPSTGKYTMVGSPVPTREISSSQELRDSAEDIAPFALALAGAAYGMPIDPASASSTTAAGTTTAAAGSAGLPGLAGGGFLDASAVGLGFGGGGAGAAGGLPTMASLAGGGGAGAYSVPNLLGGAPAAGGGIGSWGPGQWMNAISGGMSIAGGLYGMSKADDVAAAMDPFGPYRAGYAQRLLNLEANPSSISSLPGFKAGLKAIESSTAAGGFFGSGNAAAALTEFGGNFYQNELDRLAQLAGAGAAPGAGAGVAANITGQSLAGIGYGIGQLGRLFGGP